MMRSRVGIQEVLERFANCDFTCEFKYDGERAQIHLCPDGSIAMFSRNLENLTGKYPDIAALCREVFKEGTTSCVLDSEIVAYDVTKQTILPFQVLATRKRKDVETAVCVPAKRTTWSVHP